MLKLIKVVGTHSGGLFVFQFCRPKCNEIKGLAKFDLEFAVANRDPNALRIERWCISDEAARSHWRSLPTAPPAYAPPKLSFRAKQDSAQS